MSERLSIVPVTVKALVARVRAAQTRIAELERLLPTQAELVAMVSCSLTSGSAENLAIAGAALDRLYATIEHADDCHCDDCRKESKDV